MSHTATTIRGLREAVEGRDAAGLKSLYADDAVLTIIDTNNPPSHPRTISGARDIGAYFDDVCGRDMTHRIENGIVEDGRLAFVERCTYSDGTRVIASCTADLGPEGIVRQTIVQAWDS